MKDKVGIFFTDNSDRELGYNINVNDEYVGKIQIDEANQTFIEEGKTELKTNNTPASSATGEDYQININDTGRGTHQIKLINFNQSGSSTASLGAIDVYKRARLYLYIGDEEVLGTGSLSDLNLYEGDSVETLEELMQDSFVKTHSLSQPEVSTDWTEASPENYAVNGKVGAEVSFIDKMSSSLKKPIAIWRLAVPNAIASTNYANQGNALEFIQDNITQHITQLRDKFTQARLSGVVINMDNRDQNVISSYQAIIDWLRNYFDFEDLPIILTDRRGVRQEIKDTAYFKIEDRGDIIGKWYAEREMTGYYGIATTDYGGIAWNKLYELDGSEHTGNHKIRYNSGEYDAVLQHFAQSNAETDNWRDSSYYSDRRIWINRVQHIRPVNFLAGGRGDFGEAPQQFMYIEDGKSMYKTFDEWMEFFKISTYDEWDDKFAGTGINIDFLHTGRPPAPAGTSTYGQYITIPYKRPDMFDDPLKIIVAKSKHFLAYNEVVEIVPYGRQSHVWVK